MKPTKRKQEVTFRFGPADQDTGSKHLKAGELTVLENTRQLKRHDYEKRRGYGRTTFSSDVFSVHSGGPNTYLNINGVRMLESSGTIGGSQANLHFYDSVDAQFKYSAAFRRPFPITEFVSDRGPRSHQAMMVRCGSNDWFFAKTQSTNYQATVLNKNTGAATLPSFDVAASGVTNMCSVTDGTNVWVFLVFHSTIITCHKFNGTTPSISPTSTTFITAPAGTLYNNVDAHCLASGEIFVVASSWNQGASFRYTHAYLDKTTGAAKASPAAVHATGTPHAGGFDNCHGISILNSDGSNGSVYYSLWRPPGTAAAEILLSLVQVNTTTLAVSFTNTLATKTVATVAPTCGSVGYLDPSTGTRYVYACSEVDSVTTGVSQDNFYVSRYAWTGSVGVEVFARSSWVWSKPFRLPDVSSSTWHIITGTTQTNQNSYHLRDSLSGSNQCYAQIGLGQGTSIFGGDAAELHMSALPVIDGTYMHMGVTLENATHRLKINFAETYGPGVALGNKMLLPGPIPTAFGPGDPHREMTPLMGPLAPTGAATGTSVFVQVVYRMTDANGDFDRSIPGPIAGFTALPNPVVVSTLRHGLYDAGLRRVKIEIYATDATSTTPIYKWSTTNDPSVDSISVVTGSAYEIAETLYTQGGNLSAMPAPSCRGMAIHNNRVFCFGTERVGEILHSQEIEPGNAPRFNRLLKISWPDAGTQILRMTSIDHNSCAIWSAGATAAISGAGPDGRGGSPYLPQTISKSRGIKNAKASVEGPGGAYFQAGDERYYRVNSSLQFDDVSMGVVDYTSPVSCALHVPDEHEILFFLEDGKVLALDYNYPTEAQPLGQWHMRYSSGLLRAYGAILLSDGTPEHMELIGTRRAYQANYVDATATTDATYGMVIESGDLAPFDLNHQFRLAAAIINGSFYDNHTVGITLTMDRGLSSPSVYSISRAVTAEPFQTMVAPRFGDRIQSVKFRLTETGSTRGCKFSGLTLIAQDHGIAKFYNAGQKPVEDPP